VARRPITNDLYDALLRAFRDKPANFTNAGRLAGCCVRMAKRGWYDGWVPRLPWAIPIEVALRQEQEAARAEQRRREEADRQAAQDERDKARQDAVKALATEGQLLHAGRTNVLAALASASQLVPAFRKLLAEANAAMADPAFKAEPGKTLKMFKEFSHSVRMLVESSDRLIEAERRHKGEPTAVIGLDVGGMSLKEAAQTVEETTALFELARRRGLLEPDLGKNGSGEQDKGDEPGSDSGPTTH
jgi:hypothetical protein